MALNGANTTNSGHYVAAMDDQSFQHQQQQQQVALHHQLQQQQQQQAHQQQQQAHQQQQQQVAMQNHINNTGVAGASMATANGTSSLTASSLSTFASLMGLSQPMHFPTAVNSNVVPSVLPGSGPQPVSTKLPIPAIFQGKKLRFGKWTTEEEEYCDLLIRQFENGWMEGCENGCTLRSFLARKLHCAPMRISKKYAGKGIGKMIFLAKTNSTNGVLTMTEAQLAENAVKLRDAEYKFYKSIYPNISVFPAACSRPQVDNPVMHPPCFNPMAQLVPSSQPINFFPMQATPAANTTTPMPSNQGPHSAAVQTTTPNDTAPGNVTLSSPWPELQQQGHVGAAPQQGQATNNLNQINDMHNTLQQSFLNALHQLQGTVSMQGNAQMQGMQGNAQMQGMQGNAQMQGMQGNSQMQGMQGNGQMQGSAQMQGNAPLQGNSSLQGMLSAQQEYTANNLVVLPPPAAAAPGTGHRSSMSEIPDFLSGFDRVAAVAAKEANSFNNGTYVLKDSAPWISVAPQMAAAASNGTTSTEPHSPPFTSKSFDEFHRLLGNDLSMHKMELLQQAQVSEAVRIPATESLGQGASFTSQPMVRPATIVPRSETKESSNAFSADSYALFAQESARAVSEHSAYSLSNGLHRLLGLPQEAPRVVPIAKPRDIMTTDANHTNHNNNTGGGRTEFFGFQPALESASAFLTHIYKTSHHSNLVSEESGSARGGSGMDSTTGSDNASNDSDSNSEEGPCRKKVKMDCRTYVSANGSVNHINREDLSPFS